MSKVRSEGGGYHPGDVEQLDAPDAGQQAAADLDYDLVAIGAGSAAFAAAIRATALGARVAIVERDVVGGTCVNVGCIPSKNLLAASEEYARAGYRRFDGIDTRQGEVDFGALIGMKDAVVGELRQAKYLDLAELHGFDILRGNARFTGPDSIEVGGRQIRSGHFVLATGSAPCTSALQGAEETGYLTSTTAMELKSAPESMIVVGGNYVGLEMAQIFGNLGVKVTIIAPGDGLARDEEPEISQWITRRFEEEGFEVVTSARATRLEPGKPKTVIATVAGKERHFQAEEILLAIGRRPVVEGMNLTSAGVEIDEKGQLVLSPTLQTTNPKVFAAGDVTGAPQFVYVAAAQGTLAADNAISQAAKTVDYRALPRVIFTSPNIASAGMTEAEAVKSGYVADSRVLELEHVPRAIVNLDTRGAFKIVAERGSGKVLGVHIVADNAGDVILAGVYAVKFGLTVDDLAGTWDPYLTMAEGLKLTAQAFTTDVNALSCCAT
ncbi:MAG: mercury(II) reductase [Actinomycetota bacterium]